MKIEGFSNYELDRTPEGGWQIVSRLSGRPLSGTQHSQDGRPCFALKRDSDGQIRTRQLGWYVLVAHEGPPPFDGAQCCHKNGDPWDNDPGNLRWGTAADNAADRGRHGRCNWQRLSDDQVAALRQRFDEGASRGQLAIEFDLHVSYVSRLVRGECRG